MKIRVGVATGISGAMALAVLAACGGGGTGSSDNSASIDEMEPVVLTLQGAAPPEHFASVALNDYADAVEAASDGKIKFERNYSSAIAPPAETGEALASGLIDFATFVPTGTSEPFDAVRMVSGLAFAGPQTPLVGTLAVFAAPADFGFGSAVEDELMDAGLQPLLPLLGSAPNYHLLCNGKKVETLDDTDGLRARVSNSTYAAEAEALGMEPVTLDITEIYEGFQRGVVDCVVQAIFDVAPLGLLDLGTDWTIDSEVGFSGYNSSTLAMSKDRWDSLPLPARDLLWETLPVFVKSWVTGSLTAAQNGINEGIAAGIEFHQLGEDTRTALRKHFEGVLEAQQSRSDVDFDAQEFVDDWVATNDKWRDIIEQLGLSDEEHPTWEEFASADISELDFDAYVDRLTKEVLDPNRPE